MKERGLLERLTNSNGELAFYSYLLRDVRQRARPGPHCRISQVDAAFVEPLKFELFSLHSDHSRFPIAVSVLFSSNHLHAFVVVGVLVQNSSLGLADLQSAAIFVPPYSNKASDCEIRLRYEQRPT